MKWTIKSLIDWTTLYFKKHNIEEPHLEAEILLAHALNIKRIQIYTMFDRILTEGELAKFKELILRRVKREPTAYIIGYKSFMSLDFIVNEKVLIPRPETETLVEKTIDIIKSINTNFVKVLEIGTGSGAISVSLAKFCPNIKITATDITNEVLQIAKQNAEKHSVIDKIDFIKSNIFENIDVNEKFDIIISNPPYIKTAEINLLQPEIKNFEPIKALDGGEDGLDFYRKISSCAYDYLSEKGWILLECGFNQAEEIIELFQNTNKYSSVTKQKDLSDIDRVIIVKK